MIEPQYLIVVPDDAAGVRVWRERLHHLATAADLCFADCARGIVLSNVPSIAGPGRPEQACIIGTIFARDDTRGRSALTSRELNQASASRGESLIAGFWGSYVAVLAGPAGGEIVRAPFGDLPCYYEHAANATIASSHLALMIAATGVRPRINWDAIARYLIAPDLPRGETCLADVMELAGGERLTCGRLPMRQALWSPWAFVQPAQRIEDPAMAAEQLRAVILRCVEARTSDLDSALLLLSGGLDSSIVAAALAACGRRTSALNMVANRIAGDERDYARLVAAHCQIDLTEKLRDTTAVDITRSGVAGRPNPCERSFTQATRAAVNDLRDVIHHDAVLHGGGGDHIFCSLHSAAPLADLIAAHGLDRRVVPLTNNIAEVAQGTTVAVLLQAATRLIRRRARYRWPISLDYLTPHAGRHAASAIDHPWLDPPRGIGSGSAGHVALMLGALGIAQSAHASSDWRAILLAQPIIEACLTMPPWLWFARGRNRAVARAAFVPLLPPDHAWRRSKGVVDSFLIEIFEANRDQLRGMLVNGRLARQGLIDPMSILAALDDPRPARGRAWGRLLFLADVEAWLASWA